MKFVDTNILFYATGLHPESPERQNIARELIIPGTDVAFSVQVFQEFLTKSTASHRPLRHSVERAEAFIERMKSFKVVDQTLALFELAVSLRASCNYSYWDRAIIAAAMTSGCDVLLTEDMQHNHRIGGVRIVNPFR